MSWIKALSVIGTGLKVITIVDLGISIAQVGVDLNRRINGDNDPEIKKLIDEYLEKGEELDKLNARVIRAQTDASNLNQAVNDIINLRGGFDEGAVLVYEKANALVQLREHLRSLVVQPDFAWYNTNILPSFEHLSESEQNRAVENYKKVLTGGGFNWMVYVGYSLSVLSVLMTPYLYRHIGKKFHAVKVHNAPTRRAAIRLSHSEAVTLRANVKKQNTWYRRTGRTIKAAAKSKVAVGGLVIFMFSFNLYTFISGIMGDKKNKNEIKKDLKDQIADIKNSIRVLTSLVDGANNKVADDIVADEEKLKELVKNFESITEEDIALSDNPDIEKPEREALVLGLDHRVKENNSMIVDSSEELSKAYEDLCHVLKEFLPDNDGPMPLVCAEEDESMQRLNDAEQIDDAFENFKQQRKILDNIENNYSSAERLISSDKITKTFQRSVLNRLMRINFRLDVALNDSRMMNSLALRIKRNMGDRRPLTKKEINEIARETMNNDNGIECSKRTLFSDRKELKALIEKVSIDIAANAYLREMVYDNYSADSEPSREEIEEKSLQYEEAIAEAYPDRTSLTSNEEISDAIEIMLLDLKAINRLEKKIEADFSNSDDLDDDKLEALFDKKSSEYLENLFEGLEERTVLVTDVEIYDFIEDWTS